MIRREAEYFFAALRFFTRLPVPGWVGHSAAQLNHAARYFPAIGIIIGAIGAAVTLAALQLWPPAIAVLAGMAATLLATGAFHEDGLADSIDGCGGGWTKEQVLAIMKDSRIGSYGAIGIGMALLTKFEALTALVAVPAAGHFIPPAPTFVAMLIAGHSVSRFASTTLIYTLDYAREDDSAKSKPLATRLGKGELAVAALFGLAPCLLLPAAQVAIALALVAAVTLLAARYFVRRIGGYTGDCLGATQQLAELAFYLGLLCVGPFQAQHAPLWGAASAFASVGG
ncbi:MAG: adenosylcobinamide-GDP ribazoletransferase [Gammaproteobacteria bacterium]|nr:adenosylcobinamide-GDP ribazoletransferase [Rhodocyclaceae bacterium]MBU3909294.1 adenosylcobinamide-GDP ribazoletransferase [Gammaproteobacteria bacterium]MBU3990667.1 adenosylcobinamide-GDP ribazoletransferase [Gammaproteobacteria bacterium]MBU4005546.1 adenosylcobinamide-GDP ribazoletransferase [Gammaproteobacteria bacterium]MBU4020901.1 adenosylcobinamide-GDP ribazoletransferase [Gammaproteobacteria bacterium]